MLIEKLSSIVLMYKMNNTIIDDLSSDMIKEIENTNFNKLSNNDLESIGFKKWQISSSHPEIYLFPLYIWKLLPKYNDQYISVYGNVITKGIDNIYHFGFTEFAEYVDCGIKVK